MKKLMYTAGFGSGVLFVAGVNWAVFRWLMHVSTTDWGEHNDGKG